MSVTKAALLDAIREVRLAKAVLLQDFDNLEAAFLKLEQAADRTMPVTCPPGSGNRLEPVPPSAAEPAASESQVGHRRESQRRLMTKQDLCDWIGKQRLSTAEVVDLVTAKLQIDRFKVYPRVNSMLCLYKGTLFEKKDGKWRTL